MPPLKKHGNKPLIPESILLNTACMGTAYFFVGDNTFPLIRYGQPPENYHYSDNRIGSRFDPGMYIEVATATDQSLMEWCISYPAEYTMNNNHTTIQPK